LYQGDWVEEIAASGWVSNDTQWPDAAKYISKEKRNKIVIFNTMGKNDMDLSDKYCEKFMLQTSLIYICFVHSHCECI